MTKVAVVLVAALLGSTLAFSPFELAAQQGNGSSTGSIVLLNEPCVAYDSVGNDGPLEGGESRPIQITGSLPGSQGGSDDCGVPPTATSAVLSVAATNSLGLGNLRVSEGDVPPNGGVVNYAANGLDNTNTVVVPLSASGHIDLSANAGPSGSGSPTTDSRLIVVGYHDPTAPATQVVPVTPCAVSDSRVTQGATGDYAGPFSSTDQPPLITVTGDIPAEQGGNNSDCGIPTDATGVLANIVAIGASGTGHLAAGSAISDPQLPTTAFAPIGMNNAAVAWIPLDTNGQIDVNPITTDGTVHTRTVVVGYITSGNSDSTGFTAVTPCAAFDSRPNVCLLYTSPSPRD